MLALLQTKIIAGIAIALFGSAAVGTFAAPHLTPWPDPADSSSANTEAIDTSEHTEDVDLLGAPEPLSPPHGDDGDGDNGDGGNGDDGNGDQGNDVLGVPTDSPACQNVGCREVETPDGETKNLPVPAADGIENANQLAEDAQQNAGGPNDAPNGPPDSVPQGPPDDVPQGAPDGVPQGPPNGRPSAPPNGGTEE